MTRAVKRYGIAVVATSCAIALRFMLVPWVADEALMQMLLIVVVVSAWLGGAGAGLFATALTALLNHLLFVDAQPDRLSGTPDQAVPLAEKARALLNEGILLASRDPAG